MEDRRWMIPVAAVAIYAAGFGSGYLLQGAPHASGGEPSSADAPTGVGMDGEAAPAEGAGSGEAAPSDAPAAEGAPGRGEAGGASTGEGSVAVVGGGTGAGAEARPETGASSDGADPAAAPVTDAGRPAGRLDAASIRDEVASHRDEIGFCFAWQLHQHPELSGRLTMEFVIDAEGHVVRAEVADDTMGDETLQRCFRSVTQRMEFPPPEGGGEVTVRYPFILRNTEDGDEGEAEASAEGAGDGA